VSIARLFIAGALPGLLLITLFMGYTMLWAILHKERMPPADPAVPLAQKLRASLRLLPVIGLILFVLGSIYGGLATATEAAVFGVFGALVLS